MRRYRLLAKGEVTKEEFEQMKKDIEGKYNCSLREEKATESKPKGISIIQQKRGVKKYFDTFTEM